MRHTAVLRMAGDQDRRIADEVSREQSRLLAFIRRRVADPGDAEDVLQDVFAELVEANRLLMPIEHLTGWLFRVARNRITDLFRKRRPVTFTDAATITDEGLRLPFEDYLPSTDAGPDAVYARARVVAELESALAALPPAQRDVFIAHEIEGETFKDMAARTGVGINTLLSRKRYAVRHLRARLRHLQTDLGQP